MKTFTLNLTEQELRTAIKALETEKNRASKEVAKGDRSAQAEYAEAITLRNKLRAAR